MFSKTQSRALRKRRIKPDVELPESPNRALTCAYNDETVHDWNTDRRRLRHHGIVHNQVPHTTAFEQFTKFKFDQFAYANFGGYRSIRCRNHWIFGDVVGRILLHLVFGGTVLASPRFRQRAISKSFKEFKSFSGSQFLLRSLGVPTDLGLDPMRMIHDGNQ